MSIAEEPALLTAPAPAPDSTAAGGLNRGDPGTTPPERQRARPAFLRRHATLICLPLLMLIGTGLRFGYLDQPAIWFDESATFGRVCGTYQQMLDALEEAGFGPLHYSAYWWLKNGMPLWGKIEVVKVPAYVRDDGFGRVRRGAKQGQMVDARNLVPQHQLVPAGKVRMTPFMMRLIPAICGVLTIPAMYWLARELTGRRNVALLAATLTTFSAYLLNYSRDGKMYSDFWLFAVLHIAALLWWLRTRRTVPFFCWVVAGSAMLGLHLLGLIVIAVDAVIVLTARGQNWKSLLALLMLVPSSLAIAIEWLGRLVYQMASSRALRPVLQPSWNARLIRGMFRGFAFPPVVLFLVGLVLAGVGPWGYYVEFNKYTKKIADRGWAGTGLHWIREYNAGRSPMDHVRFAASSFFTGWEWPRRPDELLYLKDGSVVIGDATTVRGVWQVKPPAGSPTTQAVEIPVKDVRAVLSGQPDEKQIHIRTLRLLKGGTIALLLIAVAAAFPWRWPWRRDSDHSDDDAPARADRTDPIGPFRRLLWLSLWIVVPPLCVLLASHSSGAFAKPSTESIPAFFKSLAVVHWAQGWYAGARAHPWISITLAAALGLAFMLCARTLRGRLLATGRVLSVALITLAVCAIVRDAYPHLDAYLAKGSESWKEHDSLWMPRYLGVVLPAAFIAGAILITRLPTRTLRAAVVLLFVTINLAQFTGRVFASEPPVDRMVADVNSARDSGGTTRVYYGVPRPSAPGLGPGTGVLHTPPGRYYDVISNDLQAAPDDVRTFGMMGGTGRFPVLQPTVGMMAASAKSEAGRNPRLERIIVWDRLDPKLIIDPGVDKVLDALGPDWKRVSDESRMVRDHWTWRDLMYARRRVYERTPPPPTTTPTTASTTGPSV